MNLIIAGPSFPCGAESLGAVALRHGFTPKFIDHPHNAVDVASEVAPCTLGAHLPPEWASADGLLLPLLESWVSEGCSLPAGAALQFDRRAAALTRSKRDLSLSLEKAGISFVPRTSVRSATEALVAARRYGYPVVLRPDAGYSGRGVRIAQADGELLQCWAAMDRERKATDYCEMQSVLAEYRDSAVVEPRLGGDEWSADCAVGPAGVHLIRVCEKVTATVGARPITLGYRLADCDIWQQVRTVVERWCQALFGAGVASFACFDMRRNPDGDLVPIDFGVRLGGDGIPFLVQRSGNGRNAYSEALDAALGGRPPPPLSCNSQLALVHAFARAAGKLVGVQARESDRVIALRRVGSTIPTVEGEPVCRRVATVLAEFTTRNEFVRACHESSDWIRVEVR